MGRPDNIYTNIIHFSNGIFNCAFASIFTIVSFMMLMVYGYKEKPDDDTFPLKISKYAEQLEYGYFSAIGNQFVLIFFAFILEQYFNTLINYGMNEFYSLTVYLFGATTIILNLQTLLFPISFFPNSQLYLSIFLYIFGVVYTFMLLLNHIYFIKSRKFEIYKIDYINLVIRSFSVLFCIMSLIGNICDISITKQKGSDALQDFKNLGQFVAISEWVFAFNLGVLYLSIGIEFWQNKKRGLDENKISESLSKNTKLFLIKFTWIPPLLVALFRTVAYLTLFVLSIQNGIVESLKNLLPIRFLTAERIIASYLYAFLLFSTTLTPLTFSHRTKYESKIKSKHNVSSLVQISGTSIAFFELTTYLFQLEEHKFLQLITELIYYFLVSLVLMFSLPMKVDILKNNKNICKRDYSLILIEILNSILLFPVSIMFFVTRIELFVAPDILPDPVPQNIVTTFYINTACNWIFELLFTIQYLIFAVQSWLLHKSDIDEIKIKD